MAGWTAYAAPYSAGPGHLHGEQKIIWTTLEDGDEAAIGPYMLRIRVGAQETPTREESAPMEYSVSSSLEQLQLVRVD